MTLNFIIHTFSSPTIWMRKSPGKEEVWSPIDKGHSVLLETAWRTREKSVMISDEEVSLNHITLYDIILHHNDTILHHYDTILHHILVHITYYII